MRESVLDLPRKWVALRSLFEFAWLSGSAFAGSLWLTGQLLQEQGHLTFVLPLLVALWFGAFLAGRWWLRELVGAIYDLLHGGTRPSQLYRATSADALPLERIDSRQGQGYPSELLALAGSRLGDTLEGKSPAVRSTIGVHGLLREK